MKINYYSVYEIGGKLIPTVIVSFTDKDKALAHAEMLSEHGDDWRVISSELTLLLPEKLAKELK